MHPAIMAELEQRSQAAGGRYQMLAIPLLVEHNLKASVERVLVVDCSEALQLRRVQVRDGVTLAEARAVLAAQASRAARLALADDVIVNEGGSCAGPPTGRIPAYPLRHSGARDPESSTIEG